MREKNFWFKCGFTASAMICTIILSSCTVGIQKGGKVTFEEKSRIAQETEPITVEKLFGYAKKLSSKDYAGRLTGTPEFRACANWMASLLEEWGIKPAGESSTFLQSFPNPYTVVFVGGELSYLYRSSGRMRKKQYAYEKEYYPGSQSGDGRLSAEVAYVGYGITAPEMNYDDYADVNVSGKIVLVEPGVPVSPQEKPGLFKDWKPYASYHYKIKMAVAHGARGMLINELTVNANIDYVQNFMVAQVGESVVNDLFASTGNTHQEVVPAIKSTLTPQSFRTRKTFLIENYTEHHKRGTGYNVLGLIDGSDPILKDEVIIVGANLDHVGFCYEIIPGANDNASGIAVLLGAAETLAQSLIKPRRSVLFIGFGSKEQSFRGAETYLKEPLFPRDKTITFINLSMVGSGDTIHVKGALDYPDIWKNVSRGISKNGLHLVEEQSYTNPGLPEHDADIFLGKKIPTLIFTVTGAPTYPHTTKDTASTLTPDILSDLARILYYGVLELANSDQNFLESR